MDRRKYYLDYLRIIAILGVIFMHTGGHCQQGINIRSLNWQICNIFNSGTRWAVPIFVMISGSLFLKKDINLKKLYTKNILRLLMAFVFWSIIYTLVFSTFKYYNPLSIQGLFNTITGMFKGYYHMWFIFMIIGLYMIIPVLKICIDNMSENLLKYWMFISFIFSFCIPCLRTIPIFDNLFGENFDNLNVQFLGCYVLYFILGYYLSEKDIDLKIKKIIYILGIFSFIFTVGFVGIASYKYNIPIIKIRENFNPNVLFMSIALFLYFKDRFENIKLSEIKQNRIITLSKYTFGIYLVHELFLSNLDKLKIFISIPLLRILALGTMTFLLSLIVTHLISKIKYLNKYIV